MLAAMANPDKPSGSARGVNAHPETNDFSIPYAIGARLNRVLAARQIAVEVGPPNAAFAIWDQIAFVCPVTTCVTRGIVRLSWDQMAIVAARTERVRCHQK